MKLSIVNKEFFSKNGVVVCKATGILNIDKYVKSTFYAKGIAKVSPDDKFNLEIGKKIALARAESELYTLAKKQVVEANKRLEMTIKEGKAFCEKAIGVRKHNKEYIHKISE